jgi:hypothetical protein
VQSETDRGVAPFCYCQCDLRDGKEGKNSTTDAAFLAKCRAFSGLEAIQAMLNKCQEPGIAAPLAINHAKKLTPAMMMAIGKSSPIFIVIP